MLMEDQSSFIDFLGMNGLRFQKIKMVTYKFSLKPEKEKSKIFSFEHMAKILIDDEDQVYKKRRVTLLDPDLRSVLIVIDRVSKVAYIALFGEEFGIEGASSYKPPRRIPMPKQDDYKDPSVYDGTKADTMSYRSGIPAMPYQRTIRGNEIAPYQSVASRKSKPSDFGNLIDSIQYFNKPE